jgi:hypothetical protein
VSVCEVVLGAKVSVPSVSESSVESAVPDTVKGTVTIWLLGALSWAVSVTVPTFSITACEAADHCTVEVLGLSEPACVTMKVSVPTVSVPRRSGEAVFAEATHATVPGPVPEAPDVSVRKGESLVAVHAQPEWTETENVPVAPPAETD